MSKKNLAFFILTKHLFKGLESIFFRTVVSIADSFNKELGYTR